MVEYKKLNKNNPKVTIVLPSFNRGNLLKKSIESILNQTYTNFELIVVDDGSTDNTESVVDKIKKKDKRVIYLKHMKNMGASAARNSGIRIAKGEFIAFQDSDDIWKPNKLEKQMEIFEKTSEKTAVVYTGFLKILNTKKIYFPPPYIRGKEGYIYNSLLKENFITTQTILIRRNVFKEIGIFDEQLPRLQDWDLFLRISKSFEFKFINEPLVIVKVTKDSISSNKENLIKAYQIILKKNISELKNQPKILSIFYLNIGTNYFLINNILKGENYLNKVLNINHQLDKRLLSQHFLVIGHKLITSSHFKKGMFFLRKSIKANFLNLKSIFAFILASFGENFYKKMMKLYRKLKI